jgi:hypothetical protein
MDVGIQTTTDAGAKQPCWQALDAGKQQPHLLELDARGGTHTPATESDGPPKKRAKVSKKNKWRKRKAWLKKGNHLSEKRKRQKTWGNKISTR